MGFWFSDEEEKLAKEVQRETVKRERTVATVNNIRTQGAKGCAACPLDKARLYHGKMKPTGAKRPVVYILGEAPGETEDEQGEQFVGKAGKTLRDQIPDKYLSRVRFNNTIRCRPQDGKSNRAPEPIEVECCRQYQVSDIEETKPKAIFGFGAVPLKWITQNSSLTIAPWRGRRFPVQIGSHACWYYPMLHPSYINRVVDDREHKGEEIAKVFKWDLAQAFAEVFEVLPDPHVEPKEERARGLILLDKPDLKRLEALLIKATDWTDGMGFDIETNALRPYFPERRILTMSFSNYEETIAFSYQHKECDWGGKMKQVREMVRGFLLGTSKKWAHGLNFEMEWCAEEFGEDLLYETEWGDTLAQAYVLRGPTPLGESDKGDDAKSLGDLTLLHMGFDVKAESSVNTKNLANEPLHKVLPYNGMDAKYCYALALLQQDLLADEGLEGVYEEQARRSPTLVRTMRAGLVPNEPEVLRLEREWQKKEEDALKKVMVHPDVVAYTSKGNKFVHSSNPDVLKFLQHKFPGRVDNSQESTLEALKYPPATYILDARRAHKNISTYLSKMKRGGSAVHADGLVHVVLKHCFTTSRRLSSEDPNGQNFPKRKNREIRIVIRAPDGSWWMVCFDFGQLEARVIAMASRDKTLVKQIWEDYDIHGDWTIRLAELLAKRGVRGMDEVGPAAKTKDAPYKKFRDRTKNEWTFPLFFGSSASSVARAIVPAKGVTWDIDSRRGFPSALPWFRDVVDSFWDQYSGVKRWQEDTQKFYNEHHYVETLTGFRRHGPLSWNELINQPIQGTASDIVMDGMNRVSEMSYREKIPELQPRLNVHDELDFYFPDARLEDCIETVAREMACCEFDFINVPLMVEVSVGKNWYQQEEVATFKSTQWKS